MELRYKLICMIAGLALALPSAAGAPHLTLVPGDQLDLGAFKETELQKRTVWIKNTGDEEMVIQRIFTGCSCTKVEYEDREIAPGDSLQLNIRFSGKGRKPGPVRKTVRIMSNADNSLSILFVKGEITRHFIR